MFYCDGDHTEQYATLVCPVPARYYKQLWRRVEVHVRAKVLDGKKEAERVALKANKGIERRLAEVRTCSICCR